MATAKKRSNSTQKKNLTPDELLYKKGPVGAEIERLTRLSARVAKRAARLKNFGLPTVGAQRALEAAHENMVHCIEKLKEVPKDWRPARGSIGGSPLEAGAKISINDKAKRHYENIFDVAQPMVVIGLVGGKVLVKAVPLKKAGIGTDEITTMLPRLHVSRAPKADSAE